MPDLTSDASTNTPTLSNSSTGLPGADQSASDASDALSHLTRMSGTGSAFGQADYVAINSIAIASLLLGFASVLTLVLWLFLFIPLIGLACGLLALKQIGNSGGTQTGRGLAFGGIILSLLLGGIVFSRQASQWRQLRAQTQECARELSQLGQELKEKHYNAIYDNLTTESFRRIVDRERFVGKFTEIQTNPALGGIDSVEWNGEPMEIQGLADDMDAHQAYAMMLVKFHNGFEPGHQLVRLTNRDGSWKIDAIPQFFPEKIAKK